MTVKKIFGKLHLWLGLASGLVVIVVALSGCILVFDEEIDEWVNKDLYFVEQPAGAQRLPIDHLLQQARAWDTTLRISHIYVHASPANRSVVFTALKDKQTYNIAVNPYTGQVIRAIDYNKRFFTVVLKLHRQLLMNDVGKAITGVSCLIFVFMTISGLVIWFPKNMRILKQRLKVKWNASFKRVNWDLHAVFGFYALVPLFLISLTGLTWSYKWFNDGIFQVFDGKPQRKFVAPANTSLQTIAPGYFEKIYAAANTRLNYKGPVEIRIPASDSLSIGVSKENHEASYDNVVDFLYFEQGSGKILQERLYKDESTGMKVRRIVYPVHTGQLYGWPTKILALLSTLVAVSLPITGFYIWWGKQKKKKPVRNMQVAYVKKPAAKAMETAPV